MGRRPRRYRHAKARYYMAHTKENWFYQTVNWFNREYPRNFIISNPFKGSLIVAATGFIFMILYRPLGTHASRYFSFEITMACYTLIMAIALMAAIVVIRYTRFYSPKSAWTIYKELTSISMILLIAGLAIYFAAFILEEPADRWNLATLTGSLRSTFLVGAIPFLFFTAAHYQYWLGEPVTVKHRGQVATLLSKHIDSTRITIRSQLKKEHLECAIDELLYAESDFNYVVFYLYRKGRVKKKVLRNTIHQVASQLSAFPQILRIHRGFLVNLQKVETATGNRLGYRLRLLGVTNEIPVSRSYVPVFLKKYHPGSTD